MTNLYDVLNNDLKINSTPLTLTDATILQTLWKELEITNVVKINRV